jgi:hypothetical protein
MLGRMLRQLPPTERGRKNADPGIGETLLR